ncbi:hypothetical protein EVAR_93273_1 [Eumeta japonica]|uniref:Uncharacterized protein n=1 Tax=Eumeta variegata TaxID=151549 RepID=A0A4C1TXQ0_EUMVA|nr:hypothetical protein EVAR_93273_1 [Eumeta japonica]
MSSNKTYLTSRLAGYSRAALRRSAGVREGGRRGRRGDRVKGITEMEKEILHVHAGAGAGAGGTGAGAASSAPQIGP